jgi:hypothetical protein
MTTARLEHSSANSRVRFTSTGAFDRGTRS